MKKNSYNEINFLLNENKERIKELTCIYKTTEIINQNDSIDKTLWEICTILPQAWKYSEHTAARIIYDEREFRTENFRVTQWIQRQEFSTVYKKKGAIEIFYLKEFSEIDEDVFLKEERYLINNIASLITGFLNNSKELYEYSVKNKKFQKLLQENQERLKELSCINETTNITKEGKSIEDTLQQIAFILPKAWQFPELATARIKFNGKEYCSSNLKITTTVLRREFNTIDDKEGKVEIYYIKEIEKYDEGSFLKEERHLINNITEIITGFLNSYHLKSMLDKNPKIETNKTDQKDYPDCGDSCSSKQLLQFFLNKNNSDRDIYHDLMPFKVKEILLIANLYDAYSIEKEGLWSEKILGEYHQLNLTSLPRITGVSSYEEAARKMKNKHFDIVILMMGTDKRSPFKISKKIKQEFGYIPIYLLLNNNKDFTQVIKEQNESNYFFDKVFVWNGDSRIFFAMVKHLEDKVNVENDTKVGTARVILLVEDSPKYYSRYLPLLYSSVLEQTKHIIDDVANDDLYKVLRLRVRPKILLASSFEEAVDIFERYKEFLLCLITDVKYHKNGKLTETAGFELVNYVKNQIHDLPTVVQSSDDINEAKARDLKAIFINKNSETLIQDIKSFISHYLGFGNFIFRNSKGNKLAIAENLRQFIKQLEKINSESLIYHARKNQFSLWFMARGEIRIAKAIAPYKVSDFDSAEEIRNYLLSIINKLRNEQNKGQIVEFSEADALDEENIIRMGTGSLGGKGRGLAFVNTLLYNFDFSQLLPSINLRTPKTAIVGSDEFDIFLEKNCLLDAVNNLKNENQIKELFIKSQLSENLKIKLRRLIKTIKKPLAIRSSGLFEDSLMQPFAGIFETYLLPNNHPNIEERLNQVENAIKLVYASVFSNISRAYIEAINYKIEEEKMAVVIQEVVGNNYQNIHYPHISGVAQSYNYYPFAHMKPEDGFAVTALGLGRYVVEGEKAYRFCPKFPELQNASGKDLYLNSQTEFYGVNLKNNSPDLMNGESAGLIRLDIDDAEEHGTLKHCASVYNPENNTITAGLDQYGPRIVNFANILKYNYIPLADTLNVVLDVVKEALGTAVEIEFAVDLNKDEDYKASFYLLQIKPLIGNAQDYEIKPENIDRKKVLLYTETGMGNGKISHIRDVIFVDNETFDKSKTNEIAEEIERLNKKMIEQNKDYILIGAGRWGTRDRWIGVPVSWPQISRAKIIVETSLEDYPLDASAGSHFFHNLTSMNVGYFSVQHASYESIIVWDVLKKQKIKEETKYVKHVCFDKPLTVRMDGKKRISVITWERS